MLASPGVLSALLSVGTALGRAAPAEPESEGTAAPVPEAGRETGTADVAVFSGTAGASVVAGFAAGETEALLSGTTATSGAVEADSGCLVVISGSARTGLVLDVFGGVLG